MTNTSSLAWPNMFNVSQNTVSVYEDNQSIVSRCRLLILTDPTELYNEPNQGVGMKRYLFQYNTENKKAEIRDRIKDQLTLHEPYVIADDTQYADGLLFTGGQNNLSRKENSLEMTIAVKTTYGDTLTVTTNDSN